MTEKTEGNGRIFAMKAKLGTALALSVVAAPAFAGGYGEPAAAPSVVGPAPMAANPFEGFSVYGGLNFNSNTYDVDGSVSESTSGDSASINLPDLGGEGVGVSLGLGYDYAVSPQWVVGGFLDYTWMNNDNDASLDFDLFGASGTADYDLEQTSQFTGGLRAGYMASPSTLLYGLAGYTHGEWEGDLALGGDLATLVGENSMSYDFDNSGWSLGAGIETMLTEAVSMRIEYRYTNYDDYTILSGSDLRDLTGTPTVSGSVDMETSSQAVSMAIAYRF